jgi:endonuclease III
MGVNAPARPFGSAYRTLNGSYTPPVAASEPACGTATKALVPEIGRRLAQIFGTHAWRPDPALGPLEEVVGAIISQHTSGPNSRRAYERLRARFPTWEEVRGAPLEGIQEAIWCAGLARLKAPRLKALLAQISAERGALDLGFLEALSPAEAMAWLRHLPGVGQTTAACVLLFGMGRPVMPVDGGILRVSRRLGLIAPRGSADEAQRVLEGGVEPGEVYTLHLNLIRLGRELCTPAAPACPVCPLNDLCAHFRGQSSGLRAILPAQRRGGD